jgi:hypothetical protein
MLEKPRAGLVHVTIVFRKTERRDMRIVFDLMLLSACAISNLIGSAGDAGSSPPRVPA